ILFQTSEELFRVLENGLGHIEALNGGGGGSVVVGTGPHFAGYVFPSLYETFSRTHPSAVVQLDVDQHQRVLVNLKRRRLDLAVLVGPIDDDQLLTESLIAFDMILV